MDVYSIEHVTGQALISIPADSLLEARNKACQQWRCRPDEVRVKLVMLDYKRSPLKRNERLWRWLYFWE